MATLGIPGAAMTFQQQAIDGAALIEMTEADLLQLGVKLMGHRKMFMRELRALCE